MLKLFKKFAFDYVPTVQLAMKRSLPLKPPAHKYVSNSCQKSLSGKQATLWIIPEKESKIRTFQQFLEILFMGITHTEKMNLQHLHCIC